MSEKTITQIKKERKAARAEKRKKIKVVRSGRPPKRDVKRTKSGRISTSKSVQAETAKQTMQTVVSARIRHAANEGEIITEQEARNPLRGFVAGRKYLAGDFGKGEQAKQRLQVGIDTAATWAKCRALCGYPPITTPAMDIGRVRGLKLEGVNENKKAQIASNVITEIEGKLLRAGNGCRSVFVQTFMEDAPERENQPDHMDAILLKALDALL